jgi:hypothetical protein
MDMQRTSCRGKPLPGEAGSPYDPTFSFLIKAEPTVQHLPYGVVTLPGEAGSFATDLHFAKN